VNALLDRLPVPIADAARAAWGEGVDFVRRFDPAYRHSQAEIARNRDAALARMRDLGCDTAAAFSGTVLIDGSWYNPNYWWRLTLLRRALGTSKAREVGFLGRYQQRASRKTMRDLGVGAFVRYADFRPGNADARRQAEALVAAAAGPDDVGKWQLPDGYPAACAYDTFLKNLRTAEVDPRDPRLPALVCELLVSLEASKRLLDAVKPTLVVLSSAINFDCGTLAWIAAQRGIPVVALYGCFGVARFWKVLPGDGIFRPLDGLTAAEMDALPAPVAQALADVGRDYIRKRLAGQTTDHGAVYAFGVSDQKIDRAALAEQFGWDPAKPIVAVYAANWFDYPKSFGASQFRDFLDWIAFTLEQAAANRDVNWLFRPHPCDEWYGGITLDDLVSDRGLPNVRLSPKRWNGAAVMAIADGVVTMHGTAAIEYSCLGKPALIADQGWYDRSGFAVASADRAAYKAALLKCDWLGIDMQERQRRAEIFAGWFFGHPDWQGRLLVDDDFRQNKLWADFLPLIAANGPALAAECDAIAAWYRAPASHLHSFKMRRSAAFAA